MVFESEIREANYLLGIILGLACGAVELVLLHLLVRKIVHSESMPFWIPFAKMGALAFFLILCGVLAPSELYLTGIAAAAILIGGAVYHYLYWRVRDRKTGEGGIKR